MGHTSGHHTGRGSRFNPELNNVLVVCSREPLVFACSYKVFAYIYTFKPSIKIYEKISIPGNRDPMNILVYIHYSFY